MWEIKVYSELSYIYTYDDKVYPTPLAINSLEKVLNNSKFLNLWTDLIAVSSIKRVESKKVDDVENTILRIEDKELRYKVEAKIKQRRIDGKRVNLEILANVIEDCKWEM